MRRSFFKFAAAATAVVGLIGFGGSAWAQRGRAQPIGAAAFIPSPLAGVPVFGPPGGSINGIGGATLQGTAGGAIGMGTPGGTPGISGFGTISPNVRMNQTTAGNVGSYGRFVQPNAANIGNVASGTTMGMFASPSRAGMFGGSSMFGETPSLFGGTHQYGSAPLGTPLGNLQAGGFNAPYGAVSGNGVYAGNVAGIATYPGGLGPSSGGNYGGGYGNENLGSRGYAAYNGNSYGFGLYGGIVAPGYEAANGYYGAGIIQQIPNGPGVGNLGYPNPPTGAPAGTPGMF
jgi:hypothetical protein